MCVQLCNYVHNYDVAYHFTTKTLFENKMWKMHYLKNALNKDAEHSSESILLTPCLTAAERPFFPWIHTRTQIISKHKLGEMFGAGERAQETKNWQMTVCFLMPIYTSSEKRPLISDHIKGPLVAAFSSPLMNALDRSVKTLGLRIVTSLVTFIKSVNQSSIKPYQTGRHLVWQNTHNIISWDKQTNFLKSYSPIFLLFFVTILFTHVKNIVTQIMN